MRAKRKKTRMRGLRQMRGLRRMWGLRRMRGLRRMFASLAKSEKKRGCERSEKNENASETSGEASGECSLRSQKITNLPGHHPVARTAVAKQSSFCKSHLLLLLSMSKRTLTLWKCNKGNDLQCSIPAWFLELLLLLSERRQQQTQCSNPHLD